METGEVLRCGLLESMALNLVRKFVDFSVWKTFHLGEFFWSIK